MRRFMSVAVVMVFAGALILSACSSGKGPAEEAIKAAETAVNGAKAEAMKIVPDQFKSLEAALASAKDKFAKKDYKAALADAQAIPGKVKGVLDAAKAKEGRADQGLDRPQRRPSEDGGSHQEQARHPLQEQEVAREPSQGKV